MARHALGCSLIALLGLLSACGTGEISNAKQERFFARAESEEGRLKNYIRRYNWAKEQGEDYASLVDEAEAEFTKLREELVQLRRGNDKRAQELAGLRAETKKLDGDVAAAKKVLDEKKKAAAGAKAAVDKAEKERAGLAARLQKLKTALPGAAQRIAALERQLGITKK